MLSIIQHHKKKLFIITFLLIIFLFHQWILSSLGYFLVNNDEIMHADVAVVLNTGSEIYPRLIEAADLYIEGKIDQIVINGNRKTEVLRNLERAGFKPGQAWYEDHLLLLEVLGVPREKVISISGEDIYDTVSEAKLVGKLLLKNNIKTIIVTTSKSHTKRAAYIWNSLYKESLIIYTKSAKYDPYNPESWWHDGRQIRWVMAEYGGWLFLYWKKLFSIQ